MVRPYKYQISEILSAAKSETSGSRYDYHYPGPGSGDARPYDPWKDEKDVRDRAAVGGIYCVHAYQSRLSNHPNDLADDGVCYFLIPARSHAEERDAPVFVSVDWEELNDLKDAIGILAPWER